jgi:large subunit ribosomal protein L24
MKAELNVKKNDRVMVISGRDKGKIGKVLKVIPDKDRLVVEKVNVVKRHQRPNKAGQGGIVEKEASLHVSNVMVMCDRCSKSARVGRKVLNDGRHMRVCKKCGEQIDS